MKINLLPKSKFGKISIICILISFFMLGLFLLLVQVFNQRGGDTFFSNPLLTFPILSTFIFGVLSFIIGIYSVIKEKSISIFVFLSVLIGLFITMFGILEIVFPH